MLYGAVPPRASLQNTKTGVQNQKACSLLHCTSTQLSHSLLTSTLEISWSEGPGLIAAAGSTGRLRLRIVVKNKQGSKSRCSEGERAEGEATKAYA